MACKHEVYFDIKEGRKVLYSGSVDLILERVNKGHAKRVLDEQMLEDITLGAIKDSNHPNAKVVVTDVEGMY